jgi:thioredoxin-like negative regulator of GroEL
MSTIVARRAWARAATLSLVIPALLSAQQRSTRATPAQAQASPALVRAELAAVLLQSKKYDDAAREYRSLLSRDASNDEYRLGLARALAWGNRFRDAEVELRALQARHVQPSTVDSLLRSVRDAMEPRASEAAEWVA